MAEETATLRDTIVSDEPAPTPVVEATPATPAPETPTVDPEVMEIAQILRGSGVSKEQVNDLLSAPKALESLRYAIQNNPQEFLNMLDRTDPQTGEKFLEAMADTYVNRYGDKGKPAAKGKEEPNGELMREVEALRETVGRFQTEQQRRDQAAALAQTRQRYDARVDDLIGQPGVKELGLTKSEVKAIRARLDTELSRDPSAVERASKGNFVDVPRTFQTIIEEWASDKKAASEAAKAQRERAAKGAFADFPAGPNPFMNVELPKGTSDSWDATEEGFAKALESVR